MEAPPSIASYGSPKGSDGGELLSGVDAPDIRATRSLGKRGVPVAAILKRLFPALRL